jgi:hypothetical protein
VISIGLALLIISLIFISVWGDTHYWATMVAGIAGAIGFATVAACTVAWLIWRI